MDERSTTNADGDRVVTPPAETEPTRADLIAQINDQQAKLTTLPVIEQAKGALMAVYGLTADAAFALLRWHSQHTNVKLRCIAAELTSRPLAGLTQPTAAARLDKLLAQITDDLRSAESPPRPCAPSGAAPQPDPKPTQARLPGQAIYNELLGKTSNAVSTPLVAGD